MIEKPKRPKKIPNQDNKQPQTIEQLIRRYDLDNTKIYDFLDELVGYLQQSNIETITYKNSDTDYGMTIKYPDGTMIATQRYSVFQNCVNAYGSGLYCTEENTPPDFPVEFVSTPFIVFSETSSYGGSFAVKGTTSASTKNAGSYKHVYTSTMQGWLGVTIMALGRWK